MSPMRIVPAAALALGVTLALLLLMVSLIETANKPVDEEGATKIADILMPDTEIEEQVKRKPPEKPETPDQPPPDMPEPEFDQPDVDPNAVSIAAPSANKNIQIGGLGSFASDGEYLPIVKVAPQYPRRALSRGIEGYVIVEFTVTKNGSVKDISVVESEPSGIFDRAAMRAASKFKYKPRVIDGEPVEVPGVRNKITFALEN